MAVWSADPDMLTAMRASFVRLEQTAQTSYAAFSAAAERCAAGLDAQTGAELKKTRETVSALTLSLRRFAAENAEALNKRLAILGEIVALQRG